MIELYSWPTPNGQKIHIALEETGLAYQVHAVNIGAGEQSTADFLAINPNGKIPAIVDTEGPAGSFTLFESGAILVYLAEKSGQLIPAAPAARYVCLQWLMFQLAGIGPMFGQLGHFVRLPEKIPYAIDRYAKEVQRLLGVLETRLQREEYLAGTYSIADISSFTWIDVAIKSGRGFDSAAMPGIARWHAAIAARPGVQRGLAVLAEKRSG